MGFLLHWSPERESLCVTREASPPAETEILPRLVSILRWY